MRPHILRLILLEVLAKILILLKIESSLILVEVWRIIAERWNWVLLSRCIPDVGVEFTVEIHRIFIYFEANLIFLKFYFATLLNFDAEF